MLHLYTPWHNAGAEMMAHAMLRALAAAGHDVDVTLSRDHPEIPEPYEIDGVRVHPRRDKGDPVRHIKQGVDVIVTHLECSDRAVFLGRQFGVPVIFLSHNTNRMTQETLQRRPTFVVHNTAWMREELRSGVPSMVVHPPVSIQDYKVKPGGSITLVNVSARKGADTFYALAERFPGRHFLGVTGAYGEQDVRERSNVEILDHVQGPRMAEQVYRRTKILLVPSVYESYGRVAIEAACSGIPVIAHPTPGLREALGSAGVFVDRDDIDGWEKEIRRLLTPGGWSAASKRVAARAAELDPAPELARWVSAAEEVAARGRVRAVL